MQRDDFYNVFKEIKHPARIAVAIVGREDGGFNTITLEWFMRTSIKPPMFAISVGHTRFSYQCLQKIRYFNLCIPTDSQKEFTILSGSKSGRDLDKLKECDIDWFKGRLAGFPIIKEAAANFECKVVTQVRSGDHTIFVGEVKYSWLGKNHKVILTEFLSQ